MDRANVDTDQIIPKQYLKSIRRTGFGDYLFDAWRFEDEGEIGVTPNERRLNRDFVLNQARYQYASILLAGRNFGCGSSREHAVWALMEYGCEHGCKTFDFGRSKAETGSFAFKKNWGFEPRPLAYQYAVVRGDALPDLSPSNPKYQKKIEMWRRMPFGLTKILGPPLAKYLA